MQVWILDLLLLALFENLKVLVSSIEVHFLYPGLGVGSLARGVGLLPVSCVRQPPRFIWCKCVAGSCMRPMN